MRVAIINNGKIFPQRTVDLLVGHQVTVLERSDLKKFQESHFDLIVLTGSNQLPLRYKYSQRRLTKTIDIIRNSHIPIIGICYGCQMIAIAFGATLKDLGAEAKIRGVIKISFLKSSPLFSRKNFSAYDAHRWVIDSLPKEFEVVATSHHGPEIIKHKTKPLYGLQFHPEKMIGETDGREIFQNLLKVIYSS